MAAQWKHPEELSERAVKVVLEIRERDGKGHGSPSLGSSRARGASTARSAQSSLGLGFCRRSTATSWRSTSSSASFDAAEHASSAIHPARRTNIRYSIRTVTSPRCFQPWDDCHSHTRRSATYAPFWNPTACPRTTTAGESAGQRLCPVLEPLRLA